MTMDFARILGAATAAAEPAPVHLDIEAEKLRDTHASLMRRHRFRAGDIVRLKAGHGVYGCPNRSGLFIVITAPGLLGWLLPWWRHNDMAVGAVDSDGDLMASTVWSARFEPVPPHLIQPMGPAGGGPGQ